MQLHDKVRILENDDALYAGKLGEIVNYSADGTYLVKIIGVFVAGQQALVWYFESELARADGHAPDCLHNTLLPTGFPNYWHCTCGYHLVEVESE